MAAGGAALRPHGAARTRPPPGCSQVSQAALGAVEQGLEACLGVRPTSWHSTCFEWAPYRTAHGGRPLSIPPPTSHCLASAQPRGCAATASIKFAQLPGLTRGIRGRRHGLGGRPEQGMGQAAPAAAQQGQPARRSLRDRLGRAPAQPPGGLRADEPPRQRRHIPGHRALHLPPGAVGGGGRGAPIRRPADGGG